jgi:single-strand DNA-binding protein
MERTVNKVELEGFVGISPEQVTFKNGNSVLRFTLATSESYKDKSGNWQTKTTWHRITMMNGIAQKASTEVNRGSRVNLVGKIINRDYTNKEGKKVYVTEILAQEYTLVAIEKKAV